MLFFQNNAHIFIHSFVSWNVEHNTYKECSILFKEIVTFNDWDGDGPYELLAILPTFWNFLAT